MPRFMPKISYQKMRQIGQEMTELRRLISETFRRKCGVQKIKYFKKIKRGPKYFFGLIWCLFYMIP